MAKASKITIPFGWRRNVDLRNSTVNYISPSGSVLSSIVEVCQYLEKDDTCKCGLQCPIHVSKIFNFNPEVQSINLKREEWIQHQYKLESVRKNCQHWGKKKTSYRSKNDEPPPKLRIIRKDGKLRSEISDERATTATSGGVTKKGGRQVKGLKLPVNNISSSMASSKNGSMLSSLKFPLFESTTTSKDAGKVGKSKLQWIKADDETSQNDPESGNELCFSPDLKKSPTMVLPQSLLSGIGSPPSYSKHGGSFNMDSVNVQQNVFGWEPSSRFGINHFPVSNAGQSGTNFSFPGTASGFNLQSNPHMKVKHELDPQIGRVRPFGSTSSGTNKEMLQQSGTLMHDHGGQGWQQNQRNFMAGNQTHVVWGENGQIGQRGSIQNPGTRGKIVNMKSPTQQSTPQRHPLGSPMMNATSPFNFQMSNNGLSMPLGSPGATNPSPYSNKSQSRSSSVGTPAPSPGGPWQGPRPPLNVIDSSRPLSRSSNASNGPDASPASMNHWNNGNTNFTVKPTGNARGFANAMSPGPLPPFSPTRFLSNQATMPRFPQDDLTASSPDMSSHAYPHNFAASQQLRIHSQSYQLQQNQRFESPQRYPPLHRSQSSFGGNLQPAPHLYNNQQQQNFSKSNDKGSSMVNQTMFRPCPPYNATRIQFARINEPDPNTQPKFPFRASQPNFHSMRPQGHPVMQQQLAQQQWHLGTSIQPGQYYPQGMPHTRMPVQQAPRSQLRPTKPKRTRKRKPKATPAKTEPQPVPNACSLQSDISAVSMKAEFPEIFDPPEIPDIITADIPIAGKQNGRNGENMQIADLNFSIQGTSTTSPNLVLPANMDIPVSTTATITSPTENNTSSSLKPDFSKSSTESGFPMVTVVTSAQCTEREVTTPPLPVLSPNCLFENPESPNNVDFPDFAAGTSSFDFAKHGSSVTEKGSCQLASVHNVSPPRTSSLINAASVAEALRISVSDGDIKDLKESSQAVNVISAAEKSPQDIEFTYHSKNGSSVASVRSTFPTDIKQVKVTIESTTISDTSTSSPKSCNIMSLSCQTVSLVNASSECKSSCIDSQSCNRSSAGKSVVEAVVPSSLLSNSSCQSSFPSSLYSSAFAPVLNASMHEVTSLVSSSGTLFYIPQSSKDKKELKRRFSEQAAQNTSNMHQDTRKRYLSEPCLNFVSFSKVSQAFQPTALTKFETSHVSFHHTKPDKEASPQICTEELKQPLITGIAGTGLSSTSSVSASLSGSPVISSSVKESSTEGETGSNVVTSSRKISEAIVSAPLSSTSPAFCKTKTLMADVKTSNLSNEDDKGVCTVTSGNTAEANSAETDLPSSCDIDRSAISAVSDLTECDNKDPFSKQEYSSPCRIRSPEKTVINGSSPVSSEFGCVKAVDKVTEDSSPSAPSIAYGEIIPKDVMAESPEKSGKMVAMPENPVCKTEDTDGTLEVNPAVPDVSDLERDFNHSPASTSLWTGSVDEESKDGEKTITPKGSPVCNTNDDRPDLPASSDFSAALEPNKSPKQALCPISDRTASQELLHHEFDDGKFPTKKDTSTGKGVSYEENTACLGSAADKTDCQYVVSGQCQVASSETTEMVLHASPLNEDDLTPSEGHINANTQETVSPNDVKKTYTDIKSSESTEVYDASSGDIPPVNILEPTAPEFKTDDNIATSQSLPSMLEKSEESKNLSSTLSISCVTTKIPCEILCPLQEISPHPSKVSTSETECVDDIKEKACIVTHDLEEGTCTAVSSRSTVTHAMGGTRQSEILDDIDECIDHPVVCDSSSQVSPCSVGTDSLVQCAEKNIDAESSNNVSSANIVHPAAEDVQQNADINSTEIPVVDSEENMRSSIPEESSESDCNECQNEPIVNPELSANNLNSNTVGSSKIVTEESCKEMNKTCTPIQQETEERCETNVTESNNNIATEVEGSHPVVPVAGPSLNISPELTSTVIRQLSNYNTILKNLLVRQVGPAADIAQLASVSSAEEVQQTEVLSAIISSSIPQMDPSQLFQGSAEGVHRTSTVSTLPTPANRPVQRMNTPASVVEKSSVNQDSSVQASTVSETGQGIGQADDTAKTVVRQASPAPPDSSQMFIDDSKRSSANGKCQSESSHQGLQVPIVSSSVKGSQEESDSAVQDAVKECLASQDEVTTSIKGNEKPLLPHSQSFDPVPERRRGRSRNAANKQALKRQAPSEPAVEKTSKRTALTAGSSSSSSQRSSQKQSRIVKNGDLVWGQMRGFPSWPGKVVKPSEVRGLQQRAPLSEGKVWVKWFGDHTFTQMNPADLVTMTEGLEAHHKSRRKGRTRTRKISAHLETAIQEAVDELEQQQGSTAKKTAGNAQASALSMLNVAVTPEPPGKTRRGRKRKVT